MDDVSSKYDLPWNPNRLEQRFGRIHRIGQQEVCHLWNLVAKETREGDVYFRLLEKLRVESEALDGRVFDILGEVFEPYKEAWHLLKETAPAMLERRMESLSPQLRRVVAEAEKRSLPYELIRTERGKKKIDYRTWAQRRILIRGKRCAIYTASLLPDRDQAWDGAVFKVPKEDWAEVLLYIIDDDIYVVPREHMPQYTSLSLDSTRIWDYRNSWCVLDGADPTSSNYRRNSMG
jgi:hypothetical protein